TVRVRVLQYGEPAPIGSDWFRDKLAAAIQRRAGLASADTDGYRLVHGANDHFPGLVIDRYAQTLVLKLYSIAWIPHLPDVLAALAAVQPHQRAVLRLGRAPQDDPRHLYGLEDGVLLSGPSPDEAQTPGLRVTFRENGLRFEVDPIHGQKTGFFLDQRENRARVEARSAGKRVLDVFAYTGGFSVYAARGGARVVVSLDASQPALSAAERNFDLNRDHPAVAVTHHETSAGDAFEVLAQMGREGRQFDLIVIDPPSFAQQAAHVDAAIAAYEKLTHLGLDLLRRGGVLVQASCSSRVSADAFFAAVHRAANRANRALCEEMHTGHPIDHPVKFKEAAYLKCLFAIAP
ncbi:MAG TPA: class I SAM-dependent rRNA methyltransferase, partial [Chloroflexi bacterium]|nr:class I SAM-dependent rRNA methyltransferase [Chloroflexota bacterium]